MAAEKNCLAARQCKCSYNSSSNISTGLGVGEAIARRLRTRPLESPEMARSPEGLCDLNLSTSSWSEDRELEDQCHGMGSSPTYAAAVSKALTAPAATAEPEEEGAELLYQQQQTSAPWYCQFCHCSNHPLREFCTMCLESKK
jgi:hypothetical protein